MIHGKKPKPLVGAPPQHLFPFWRHGRTTSMSFQFDREDISWCGWERWNLALGWSVTTKHHRNVHRNMSENLIKLNIQYRIIYLTHTKKTKTFLWAHRLNTCFSVCRHGRNTSMSLTIYTNTWTKQLKVYRIDMNIEAHIENQCTYMEAYKKKIYMEKYKWFTERD